MGAADAMVAGLLDVLGLRKIEPVRERVTAGCCGGAWLLAGLRAIVISGRSTILFVGKLRPPRMLPWPVGEGNWVSLKSAEADSKLLWRSSKLTDGRNSKDVVVLSVTSSGRPSLPPKENKEWLFEDEALSIGASIVGRMEPILVGLGFSVLLNCKTKLRLAKLFEQGALGARSTAGRAEESK